MNRLLCVKLILFCFALILLGQTYKDDSLAVRAILDSNGLNTLSVEKVTYVTDGRISALSLSSLGIKYLPKEIAKLSVLKQLNILQNNITTYFPHIDCGVLFNFLNLI